jgi:hypothetical protein
MRQRAPATANEVEGRRKMKMARQERKMAIQYSQLTRHDLEAKIVKHSWQDEGFRKELIADPAGTFVKYLDVPAAGLPKIVVHEEQPGSWHVVMPAGPANTSEISEKDLEKVAGGETPYTPTLSVLTPTSILSVLTTIGGTKPGW